MTLLTALRDSNWSPNTTEAGRLVALSAYVVAAGALLWGVTGLPTVVRIPLALPLLLFAPGYAFLSAIAPVDGGTRAEFLRNRTDGPRTGAVGGLERVLLAVVASVVLVPMAAVVANALVGVQFGPVVAVVAIITIICSVVGIYRAQPAGTPDSSVRGNFVTERLRRTPTDPLTLGAIVLTVVLLASSVPLAIADSGSDSVATEFYVSDEDEAEATYDLRIAQDEVESQRYTVVVVTESDATGSVETELDRFSTTVSEGQTASRTYQVPDSAREPGTTLQFLLYTGDAPDSPDPADSHRAIRQTVNATG